MIYTTLFRSTKKGSVKIDDYDLREVELKSLRERISVVLQDTFIFSGNIMENIRFGRPEATDQEVIEAAKVVDADDFIASLANGYQTEVEERGSNIYAVKKQL